MSARFAQIDLAALGPPAAVEALSLEDIIGRLKRGSGMLTGQAPASGSRS